MDYTISKILPLFAYPLGLAIFLGIVVMLFVGKWRESFVRLLLLIIVAMLWVCSTPVFSAWVLGSLEKSYPPVEVSTLPEADAIVILGGIMRDIGNESFDLGASADRLFHGLSLYKAGKAPVVMLVGGSDQNMTPESILMAKLLAGLGVAEEAMLMETGSRTTRQNAENAVDIMRKHAIHRILLVTSASHMKRAKSVFESFEIEVIPAATDYQARYRDLTMMDWLPDVEALLKTTYGIKEYLGWWVYKIRGWV